MLLQHGSRFQMLEFKMANAVTAIMGSCPSTIYKAVPNRSTSAISSGLGRLFGTRESSVPRISQRRQEWEATTAHQRHKRRGLDSVNQELDEYLEDPLETFSKIERVDGIERTVFFDALTYWQVRAALPPPHLPRAMLTSPQTMEKRFPNLFCLAMDVLPAQASSVPCERLFSSGKETCTPRRNRIDPKLMEVLQTLKLSSRNCSLNLTEHLSARFYSLEGDDLEISEVFEEVYNTEGMSRT